MFGKASPGQPGRGHQTIEKSLHGLATTIAILAALACAGPIFEYGMDPATDFFADAWGYDFGEIGGFAFCTAGTMTVFFIARIAAVIGLTLLASRGLMYAI